MASSLLNFFLNKKVVFRSQCATGKALLRYYGLAIPILLLQLGLSHGAYLLFSIGSRQVVLRAVIYGIVMIALFLLSYVIQQRWVFTASDKEKD